MINYSQKVVLRYSGILLGIFFMSNGIVLLVQARLGVDPWNVLHLGISQQFGFRHGHVIQGVGLFILLLSFLLGERLGLGTFLNMYLVGLFVNIINTLGYFPEPVSLWGRVFFFITAIFCIGFGSAMYISGNRGAGPRDSLMLALKRHTKMRVGIVRGLLEVTVTAVGWLLGGPLGLGTVIYALAIGVSVETGFAVMFRIKKRFFAGAISTGV